MGVKDPKPMKVYEKSCGNCLFANNRLVNKPIADEIIKNAINHDQHFTCHKATLEGEDICCHSFFKLHGDKVRHTRFASIFDLVDFVPLPDDSKITPDEYFEKISV